MVLMTRVVPLTERAARLGTAFSARAKNAASDSIPTLRYPTAMDAAIVEPAPMKGSRMIPSPRGNAARTICRMKACGFSDGCGAILRSSERVGADAMTSAKGASFETLLSPPVFHLRRLSCTRPSHGLRNTPHGSQHERGMTVTSENSLCAFLGRSPPRSV